MNTADIRALTGTYRGKTGDDGITAFLGVPYAKKPGRFRRAESLEASGELVEAYECGQACPQPFEAGKWSAPVPMGEDCLWLNIWTDLGNPGSGACGKPVLVWIHGGSFAEGSARLEYSFGSYGDLGYLASLNRDIVFVSINYRVNLFGSLDLSVFEGSEGYEGSTDLEFYDMIEALSWVNRNIKAFGGDPDRVTIMGQSAGGWACLGLSVIPEANRLFCRAIASSSGFAENVNLKTPGLAAEMALKVKDRLGVSTVAELLEIPAQTLGNLATELLMQGVNYEPVAGGGLFPEKPSSSLENGAAAHIAFLAGSCEGDLDTMVFGSSAGEIRASAVRKANRGIEMGQRAAEAYLSNYPGRSEAEAYRDYLTDIGIRMRIAYNMEAQAKAGGRVYLWYCDYMAEKGIMRTQHTFDVINVFGKEAVVTYMGDNIPEPVCTFEPSRQLSLEFMSAWMSFVRTGSPECLQQGLVWAPYEAGRRRTMRIGRQWQLLEEGVRPLDTEVAMAMHSPGGYRG